MKKMPLKLCVVTGSRAEYGLLLPLMKEIKSNASWRLQVIATGMHLSPEFGLTFRQIEEDGFNIDEKVEMLLSGDTNKSIISSTGLGMIGMASAFERLQPDWIILLGDRFETFAAASAAHLAKIPVMHLHGGEITEGSTDDAMRHAITKMSYLHFTSTPGYRKRVIQLGEHPARVFHVGAIGLDNLKSLKLLSKNELEKALSFDGINLAVLVTFHPATLDAGSPEKQMQSLLQALDEFPEIKIIFTMPNADANGRVIIKLIEDYVQQNRRRSIAFTSLGQLKYLSLLKYVKAVAGNSSSGIIEAPAFGIPTVNVGSRQDGRIKPGSVIDAAPNKAAVVKALRKAFSPEFAAHCKKVKNPYGNGTATAQISKVIKKTGKITDTQKSFYDL